MNADSAAAQVSAWLNTDAHLRLFWAHCPNSAAIPLGAMTGAYGLVINLYVRKRTVSLPLVWRLTVEVIRDVADRALLAPFRGVEVRVFAVADGEESQRVVAAYASSQSTDLLPSSGARELLKEWRGPQFSIHWYYPKDQLPLEEVQ